MQLVASIQPEDIDLTRAMPGIFLVIALGCGDTSVPKEKVHDDWGALAGEAQKLALEKRCTVS